ncbi:hypothetical protein GCM10009117_04160 [Gangjinia marincola]|uniref:Uncharacterized protein n=1 Tax=Gangjinia marincola TaxID=578463 RepID=A0ABN1MDZ6_9FLAO
MKQLHKIAAALLCAVASVSSITAQKKAEKLKETFLVKDEVTVSVDTRYANIVFETWDKDKVEVEAYIESEDGDAKELLDSWDVNVTGNSSKINIRSTKRNPSYPISFDTSTSGLEDIIAGSLQIIEPTINNVLTPLMESLTGAPLPPEYYREMNKVKFDYDEYKKRGKSYLKEYNEKVEKSFGKDYEKAMEKWEKQHAQSDDVRERFLGIPASPFGNNVNINTSDYEEDPKGWLKKMNDKHDTNVSKKEMDEWLESVEAWGERFGKRMEVWGENFGARFGKSMEAWGESFGKDMEVWGEDFGKRMEVWAADFEKDVERQFPNSSNQSGGVFFVNPKKENAKDIKRTIIVKMPKGATLDLNVRYGNVKLADLTTDLKAVLSHTSLLANAIDGRNTSVKVAYAPIKITTWKNGVLTTKHVKNCEIESADVIKLNSNASNVLIKQLNERGQVFGSFGRLQIPNVGKQFKALELNLENSDMLLSLPQVAFTFSYIGNHSKIKYPKTINVKQLQSYDSEVLNGFYKSRSSDNLITINAKFSDVVVE